jgi:hypothetical protein
MKIAMKEILTTLVAIVVLSPTIADAKANSCPSQNFPTFLKAYQNNLDIQKAFTVIPLKFNNFYPDFGEKPNVSYLTAADLYNLEPSEAQFPVFNNAQALKAQGVKMSMKKQASRRYRVQTGGMVGTGANTYDFDFKKLNGCWRLVEVTDYST